MATIDFTGAFAKYGAKLHNYRWSVSAFAPDGALVVSLYAFWMKREESEFLYRDKLSDWKSRDGANELSKHLDKVKADELTVKLILVDVPNKTDEALVGNIDESKINKKFVVRKDLVGTLKKWDGDNFVIAFSKV
jgi:hypothetical protein